MNAYDLIRQERERQDEKWGEQNHLPSMWMLIAQEEMGEVAKAILERKPDEYRQELIQAAAVLTAWLECELRRIP